MDLQGILNVHPLLADRVRLALMVAIASSKDAVDFGSLREELDLTKGNLSSHLRKLEESDLINVKKSFVDRRPRTTYRCTNKGKACLKEYLTQVEKILGGTLAKSLK